MNIPEASHPIWRLARTVVITTAVTIILLCTASDFDETEVITILLTFLSQSGAEGLEAATHKRFPPREKSDGKVNQSGNE